MSNWKSLVAFVLFVSAYGFMVVSEADVDRLEVTGNLALIAMGFIMVRSDGLKDIIKTFINKGKT